MWTTEQIIALASDSSSAKNGRALANAAKWPTLGRDERAVWGECQGSGKNPYQAAIDLSEPAFKCSCPSRKFPCKHGLGLFLLFVAQENLFKNAAPPSFCADWLEKRDAQKVKKETKDAIELTDEEKAKREKSKEKRAAGREQKIAEGLRELEIWLKDLIRHGLATAKNQPPDFWEKAAKRMIDAQAPGVARLIGELSGAISRGENWAGNFLARVGKIFLLVEAFKNLENLPEPIKIDVQTALGQTVKESELENVETISDEWLVAGQKIFEEAKLRGRRTWLTGEKSRRAALILDFAFQNQTFPASFPIGAKFSAELGFYPGNFPLRAVVKNRGEIVENVDKKEFFQNFAEFFDAYAAAAAKNLWLENFPVAFGKVALVIRDEKCFLRDERAELLPLRQSLEYFWPLIAFAGGREIEVFGEWDGATFDALNASDGERIFVI